MNRLWIETKRYLRALPGLVRGFPYFDASAQYVLIFAYLYDKGWIDNPTSFLMALPFIFANAAGFAYNNYNDQLDPAIRNNPIAAGKLPKRIARWFVLLFLFLSVLSFGLFFQRWQAWLIFFLYILLGLAYSGLHVRLKETIAGPFIAAFVIWTAGPVLIALEFAVLLEPVVYFLIFGIYGVSLGREIFHTRIDRENDLMAGYRTLGVRVPLRVSFLLLIAALVAGAAGLISSIIHFRVGQPLDIWMALLIGLVSTAVILELTFSLAFGRYHPTTAFLLFRLSFILFAAIMLGLSPLLIVLLLWVFLMGRQS